MMFGVYPRRFLMSAVLVITLSWVELTCVFSCRKKGDHICWACATVVYFVDLRTQTRRFQAEKTD